MYHAFRSIIVIRPSEVPLFDEAFDLFFGMGAAVAPAPAISTTQAASTTSGLSVVPSGSCRARRRGRRRPDGSLRRRAAGAARLRRDVGGRERGGAPAHRQDGVAAGRRRSRRYAPSRSGSQPDLRRTLRGAVGHRGRAAPVGHVRAPPPPQATDRHRRCERVDGAVRRDAALLRSCRPRPAGPSRGVRLLHPPHSDNPPVASPRPRRRLWRRSLGTSSTGRAEPGSARPSRPSTSSGAGGWGGGDRWR